MKDLIKISVFFAICLILGLLTLYRLGYFNRKEKQATERNYVPSNFDEETILSDTIQ